MVFEFMTLTQQDFQVKLLKKDPSIYKHVFKFHFAQIDFCFKTNKVDKKKFYDGYLLSDFFNIYFK